MAVGVAASLAGVLGSLAEHAWWLELFAHFRPQYAAVLATCGLGLVALSPRVVGLLCLALAGANAAPLAHYYAAPARALPGGEPFKAVFANVYFGNRDYGRVLDFVRRERPDFAVFSEVTPPWERQLGTLADVLPFQAHAGEILVASRRPLAGLRSFALSRAGATAVVWQQGGLAVVGGHANWPLGERIAALRDEELVVLGAIARSVDGPVVVLADLNVTAFSPAFSRLLARSRLADCSAGHGWHPTWPVMFPPLALQIDHCLHSTGVAIDAVRRGPAVGSDHYPLVIEGRVPPSSGERGELSAMRGDGNARQRMAVSAYPSRHGRVQSNPLTQG